MKIKQITSQNRRDFQAIMICEHCADESLNKYGYDDDNYHKNVIPDMECKNCGLKSPNNYVPVSPKYSKFEVV